MNANIAIRSIGDIHEKMKELKVKWSHYVLKKQVPKGIRKHIYQSWERCHQLGIDPRQQQTSIVMSDEQLSDWINRSHLYQISLPILDELAEEIKGTKHLIALCDHTGKMLYLRGDREIRQRAEKINFVLGSDWNEASFGTNAIGTALVTEQPIQIFSYEHFCEGCHPWVCSASPIRDPFSGHLLGVIDITGPSDLAQPHTLGTVTLAAKMIEKYLHQDSLFKRDILKHHFEEATRKWKNNAIAVLDIGLRLLYATPETLSLFDISHPEQFWSVRKTSFIKSALLTLNHSETEIDWPELHLTVFIQTISNASERIGYLLLFDRSKTSRISSQNSPSIRSTNQGHWSKIIGESKLLKEIIYKSQIVSSTNVPVLIIGESGTGKEQFAKAIHYSSPRHQGPFIAVNCGAIPKELFASELFGYEPGTFTGGDPKGKTGKFEDAQGGTLFLDEIGEMPLDMQVMLLRVLEEKSIVRLGSSKPIPIDVRIIAATNQDLEKMVKEGKFRVDLFYRLNVVQLKLPPLRERGHDLVLLCHHFIQEFAKQLQRPVSDIDEQALSILKAYSWPGNIRELKNVIQHAVLFAAGEIITPSDLPSYLQANTPSFSAPKPLSDLEAEEKRTLEKLFVETKGNLSEMARRCHIARSTLYRKLRKYNLI